MPFVISYSEKVRSALKRPVNVGIDVLVILAVAGLIASVALIFGHAAAPRPSGVEIDLRFRALPKYAFYSLSRAFIAYGISLLFTLIYGTVTAHSRMAEKIMIPILDVLQSLPVLSFLPGLVLVFVRLFPTSWLGLEIACVIMIFTAQAWNMTFSYHATVRAIPDALREAAAIQRLSGWQSFRFLELPASMIGLVWNSMMSMAGGWFVITVEEAFTLNNVDYRLPGLGSYMNQAQIDWNVPAMIAGVVAMILVIVLCDQVVWRPIVAWSERFKLEDVAATEQPKSWVLTMLRRSGLIKAIESWWKRRHHEPRGETGHLTAMQKPQERVWLEAVKWLIVAGFAALAVWGAIQLFHLMTQLPLRESGDQKGWTTVLWGLLFSFLRTSAAVVIGALWTLPAGVLIGLSPRWSNRLQPLVQIVASFPAPMLYLMICILLVKVHIPFTFGCVVLMLMGTQWYTLFNVIAGAMAIPSDLREAGKVYHLSVFQRWMRIYIPAVFPYLATGLITAAGGAWNATIVAEYVPTTGNQPAYYAFGLGAIIEDACGNGEYALLAAAVFVMGLTVVIINRLLWKRIYRLAEARYSLNA
jgi:NitT/TauT family transport system permease protein